MVPAAACYQWWRILDWLEEEEIRLRFTIQTFYFEDLRVVEAGENGQLDSRNQSSCAALSDVYKESLAGLRVVESSYDLQRLAFHQGC